jgi:glucosamine kinase
VYVLGVDGGASSTRAVVGTQACDLLGFGRAGPSNHLQGEAGRRRLRGALTDSITAALHDAGVRPDEVQACWLGMTGTWGDRSERDLIVRATRELVPCPRIEVGGDVHGALVGASFGRPGVIVYAGTGSIAYALDEHGEARRTGGWGYLIDDAGGAYHVGRAALTAVFRASDGRAPPTSLRERLLGHLRLDTLEDLRKRVYLDDGMDRPSLARLARVVAEAADSGDSVAASILETAAVELARLAIATLRKLPADQARHESVYVAGGLFDAGPALLEPFTAALQREYPGAAVHRPALPPIVGSFIMALRMLTEPALDEAQRRRIESAIARLGIS